MSVRFAVNADIPALCAIELESFSPEEALEAKAFHAFIKTQNTHVLVCELPSRVIVGYAMVLCKREARLYSLAVSPTYRGHGAGRELLDSAEALLWVQNKYKRLILEVRQSNESAINLYHRHGFEDTGVELDYYPDGEAAIRMAKNL